MVKKTQTEMKTWAATVNVGDRFTLTWRQLGTQIDVVWTGVCRSKIGNDVLNAVYDDFGEQVVVFPPSDADCEVWSYALANGAAAQPASMSKMLELSRVVFSENDVSTWKPFLKDHVGVTMLLGLVKQAWGMYPAPRLSDKYEKARAHKGHYFEKLNLCDVLEGWLLAVMGPVPGYDKVPLVNVARVVISRMDAFLFCESTPSASLSEYMTAVRNEHVPKSLVEFRKIASSNAKNGDFESP